jgi:alkylation response protein AidB-like acyl-CoA dehydrogenase
VTFLEDSDDPYLASARDVLRSMDGTRALASLDWIELLDSLDSDSEARRALFAFFRAQGRELGSSGALGHLTAHPYGDLLGSDRDEVAAVERRSARRGHRMVVVGAPTRGRVLIDQRGRGVSLVDVDAIELRPLGTADGLLLAEVESDLPNLPIQLEEQEGLALRDRRVQLGRIALACEILGAAEGALASAIQHARDREQFGRPIGHFQAVRHLLAASKVDCSAIQVLADLSIEQYPELPPLHDAMLKAVAGRNGRRICERSLQVLGAMGFTAEHPHHRFHSRVLVLDALMGTSTSLTHQLGTTLRTSQGGAPDLRVPLPT